MKGKHAVFLLMPLIVLTLFTASRATVEWDILSAFKMEEPPVDIAVSLNGQSVYVLTAGGIIYIYWADGNPRGKISVGKSIDGIKVGPREDILFLTSRKNKTVQIINLSFLYKINVSGSPFKGPVNAPVVIAVFSDFQ